jgi:uncharacterized membrane protein YuzA (DUF378 family)
MQPETHWRALIDFFTLFLVLAAGLELGLIGLFSFSPVSWLFGGWMAVYNAIGIAAIWQLSRQRLFN